MNQLLKTLDYAHVHASYICNKIEYKCKHNDVCDKARYHMTIVRQFVILKLHTVVCIYIYVIFFKDTCADTKHLCINEKYNCCNVVSS